jgi:hypothetical protein
MYNVHCTSKFKEFDKELEFTSVHEPYRRKKLRCPHSIEVEMLDKKAKVRMLYLINLRENHDSGPP